MGRTWTEGCGLRTGCGLTSVKDGVWEGPGLRGVWVKDGGWGGRIWIEGCVG